MPDPKSVETPLAECDVVMKGGITSGVVYPLAVVELAKKYRFKNVGGASAGAIAAALTAAAELGREQGAFGRLEAEARAMGTKLRTLFQPSRPMRPLFEVLMATLAGKSSFGKVCRFVFAALRRFWLASLLGLAPAAALAWFGRETQPIWALGIGVALLALVGWLVAIFWRLTRILTQQLPEQAFGFCPGIRTGKKGPPALMDWLADLVDDLAGVRRKPLTFGDLWGEDPVHPRLRLLMMTSNLTVGRPHAVPYSEEKLFHPQELFFKPEELERQLPKRVVAWMEDHAEPYEHDPSFLHLPAPAEMPVVAVVRMSLAFPLLFEAVPLYACDYTLAEEAQKHRPRRVWMSDGGLCSNFPIHFFDGLWPSRPTFGITLEPFVAERHQDRVWLPSRAGQGIVRGLSGLTGLGSFFGSLVDTMQEWQDNLQSTLPGYRERIVHVRLDAEEGGLNLDMDPEVIARLVEMGTQAGTKLNAEFNWDAHRWTRGLSSMEQVQETLAWLDTATLEFVAARDVGSTPYPQSEAWLKHATATLESWRQVAAAETAGRMAKSGKFPNPKPKLRPMPRL